MRRRRLLAAMATSASVGVAGCLDLAPSASDEHPFAGTRKRVVVENASTSEHDLQTNAEESLAFWAENSQEFAGFEVDFRLVEDDPDLVIRYADDPRGCEAVPGFDSERVLGCAPLLGPARAVPRPVVARVVASGRPYGSVRATTQHEIGHVLGLNHDDEPRSIMSNRPEDRIPLYAVRLDIWEAVLAVQETTNGTVRLLNHGVETYAREEYGAAGAAFEAASEEFASLGTDLEAARTRVGELTDPPAVETVDLPALRERLAQLRERLDVAATLAEALARAAAAARAGDRASVEAALATADDHIATFNRLATIEIRDVAVALGLVRGFDREEPVVDLDGEDVAV